MRKNLFFILLFFVLAGLSSYGQPVPLAGKITDEQGASISGATIIEKGTRNGTTAASDGSFNLKVKTGASLLITAIGFEEQTVKVSSPTLAVKLASDVRSLSEVVVTGVGVATSKKKLGISVEAIAGDKLPKTQSASIDQALVGKIAGAQISSVNGSPGAKTNILLRGINTINRGTTPMILLDGVEVRATDLNSLDLNGIERIEVVQGAASAT
nr:TonB-dependent receptor plug domain-containing protein [Segetibacter sp.]